MATKLTIRGVLWEPSKPDDLRYSVVVDGVWCYAEIATVTDSIRAEGGRRGLSLGEMADWVNAQIRNAEERQMQDSGLPSVIMSFTAPLTPEIATMFGVEMPQPATKRIDGDTE